MSNQRDTLVGILVIAIAIALFIASFFIREFTRTSLGAGFVPQVTAIIFAFLGLTLIIRERRARANAPAAKPAGEPEKKTGVTGAPAVMLNILLFVVYLLLLEKVGFIILTPIYVFLQILLLTDPAKYRIGWFAVLSVAVGVLSYYMFVNIFQVMLPGGILS